MNKGKRRESITGCDLGTTDEVVIIENNFDVFTLEEWLVVKGEGGEERLTKREELSFLTVLALPKASSTGTVSKSIVSTLLTLSIRAANNEE